MDASGSLRVSDSQDLLRRLKYGFFNHDEAENLGTRLLVATPFGTWAQDHLQECYVKQRFMERETDVDVVGVSLLHAGQVIPAIAISMLVRDLWPKSLVVRGGPHINGLGQSIVDDIEKRTSFAADVFVQGHAEETFMELLDQVGAAKRIHQSVATPLPVLKGSRGKLTHIPLPPRFSTLDVYSQPMTLPLQSSLGCAIGKCAFCTYPAMEGKPVQLSLQNTVVPMVERAMELGEQKFSGISFKDSLVTTKRLRDIATCVQGRVPWSACAKLTARLCEGEVLHQLNQGGLATLEVGLESLLPDTQRRIGKIQSQALFESFISHASTVPDLCVVVNYLTGFPWEDPEKAQAKLELARDIVRQHLGGERGKVEHNTFELERLSPMAQNPGKYGINWEKTKTWPWASVIE